MVEVLGIYFYSVSYLENTFLLKPFEAFNSQKLRWHMVVHCLKAFPFFRSENTKFINNLLEFQRSVSPLFKICHFSRWRQRNLVPSAPIWPLKRGQTEKTDFHFSFSGSLFFFPGLFTGFQPIHPLFSCFPILSVILAIYHDGPMCSVPYNKRKEWTGNRPNFHCVIACAKPKPSKWPFLKWFKGSHSYQMAIGKALNVI